MTLAQLTDYVCQKAGLTEDEDRSACQGFISKRYELIYNSYLWKDSLAGVDITVDPVNNADNAEGIMLLPEVIDRVVAIRTPDANGSFGRSVRVRGLEDFYRVDYDKFSKTGTPYEFALLSPVWFVWRGYGALQITGNASDTKQMKVTWRDRDGKRYVQLLSNGVYLPGALTNAVPAGAQYDGDGTFNPNLTVGRSYYYYDPSNLGNGVTFLTNGDTQVPNNSVFVAGSSVTLVGAGPDVNVTAYLVATDGNKLRVEIESVFKQATTGVVSFAPVITPDGSSGTLQASDTRSPAYQRVRLFNIPTGAITLSVLGKKKFVPLDFDEEEPEIKNLDNCLIAFAMADMLKRARQFAKAQTETQEATVLLAELAKLETVQAAHNSRIIPDGGYGDVFFAPGRSGGFWEWA
jgi:hypothetical protein